MKENFKEKYLKYKSKYVNLINQFGGTAEEYNNFLLHGTNLFYIDDIIKNGLTGKYNQEIYDIIKRHWSTIRGPVLNPYVKYFLDRQQRIIDTCEISLSFTGRSSVASEYSEGTRRFGEGPSRFINALQEYIHKNPRLIDQQMKIDYDFLDNAIRHPGIILAIDKIDFEETQDLTIRKLYAWEYTLNFSIPPNKLYIRRGWNDYIKLLSEEGTDYISKLKLEFLDQERIRHERNKIAAERAEENKKSDEWVTDTVNGPELYVYSINKRNGDMNIKAQYDIYIKEKDYLYITMIDYKKINIRVNIQKIVESTEYEKILMSTEGLELFMDNHEFKDKLKLVIEGIMSFINAERKEKILKKVIEIFPQVLATQNAPDAANAIE